MQILTYDDAFGPEDKRPNLNYKISSMPRCPQKMTLGSPVKVVGYPAFTRIDGPGIWDDQAPKTVTEGTISAYYSTLLFGSERDPMPNYFISAKVDSGVSGGVAFSVSDNKLCLLGIPTWLNPGVYETQGIVQNIHNVLNQ